MALNKYVQNIGLEFKAKSDADITRHEISLPKQNWITDEELSKMKDVHLRSAEQTKSGSAVVLQQFNPTSLLNDSNRFLCRIPGCSAKTRPLKPTIKHDLFLCKTHHAKLWSLVSERCAEENVIVNFTNFKNEDFIGYTALIAKYEKEFMFYQRKASMFSRSTTDSKCAELFLNSRNFLLITNALLNPDVENITTALVLFMPLFNKCLSYLEDPVELQKYVITLQEIVEKILLCFGVIYSWISLANPCGKIGAGLGFLVGSFGAAMWTFPPAGIVYSSLVGLVAGGLIGSGSYELYKERYRMQMLHRYREFMFEYFRQDVPPQQIVNLFVVYGRANGDLNLQLEQNY